MKVGINLVSEQCGTRKQATCLKEQEVWLLHQVEQEGCFGWFFHEQKCKKTMFVCSFQKERFTTSLTYSQSLT